MLQEEGRKVASYGAYVFQSANQRTRSQEPARFLSRGGEDRGVTNSLEKKGESLPPWGEGGTVLEMFVERGI